MSEKFSGTFHLRLIRDPVTHESGAEKQLEIVTMYLVSRLKGVCQVNCLLMRNEMRGAKNPLRSKFAGGFESSAIYRKGYIMPGGIPPPMPIPPPPIGISGFSSGLSATMASVVSISDATLAAF